MKTKEFVRRVEALGYEVSYNWGTLYIKRNELAILDLGYVENWDIDTDYPGFEGMGWNDKKELMTIVSEYMLTDPIDRKEEKRYRLRIAANLGFMDDQRFLNLNIEREEYFICSARQSEWVKTIFTESEIAEMDITGFEKVEVEE